MCLNDCCFNFQKFSKSKVAVFISGPGNLEFPWALETALRLKSAGAQVTVFDVSDYSLTYSARIKVLGKQLPIKTRKILRGTLLMQNTLIENRISNICSSNDIPYFRSKSSKKINKRYPRKLVKISDFNDVYWGLIRANEIIHTHLSSKYKKNLTDDDLVPLSLVMGIRQSIMETFDFIQNISPTEFSYYFVCNGRQPVQAALSTYLRNLGCCVYLYEGGGGYVFPEILTKHIDYWETSPANHVETQSKILCPQKLNKIDRNIIDKVISAFRTQSFMPYVLNYLTNDSPKFDEARLGVADSYAFFTTSQYEFSILNEQRKNPQYFQNQIDAVQSILNNLNSNDKLFIRVHPGDPNMPTQPEPEWEIFRENRQVEIIDSNDRVNSYDLAKYMRANFVWESIIGYEFAVTDIPIAIMSEAAIYAPCMPEICVYDEEMLKKFIMQPILPKFESLLSYANYLAQGGFQIKASHEEPDRKIFLLNERVDIYKEIFKKLSDKIRIYIT
jgi:hypothetical protein